jgi:cytochrome c oxidase subunit 2
MQKWILFVLFIGAGVLGLGVLFQQISDRQAATASEANAGKQLKIVASNWKFDQAEYTVTKGEATKVALVLKEGVHAINIKGEGVDITLDKNTPSQEVKFDKPGTYDLHCVLPCGTGHADMKSKIVVQ